MTRDNNGRIDWGYEIGSAIDTLPRPIRKQVFRVMLSVLAVYTIWTDRDFK